MEKIKETYSIKDSSGQFEVLLEVNYKTKKWTIGRPGFCGFETTYMFKDTCNFKAGIIVPRLIEKATAEAWRLVGNEPEELNMAERRAKEGLNTDKYPFKWKEAQELANNTKVYPDLPYWESVRLLYIELGGE